MNGLPQSLALVLLAAVACAVLSAPLFAKEPAQGLSAVPDRDAMLDRMAVVISRSIARTDTEHPVFHGSYDWHSAVHGHWALLRIARVTGKHADAAADVDARMTVEGLAKEQETLRADESFEMPYGRAWFLRLAIEHELWGKGKAAGGSPRLRKTADAVASSLLAHFDAKAPSPETSEYANSSWALLQLHDWYRHVNDAERLEKVREHVRQRFLGAKPSLTFAEDASRPEFFSRFGNQVYLVAKTQNAETLTRFLADHPIDDAALAPIEDLKSTAHHFGMNWSRAWALRALSRAVAGESDRRRFDRAYLEHVRVAIGRHERMADDYMAYGHWVPQFAVYALTEGD